MQQLIKEFEAAQIKPEIAKVRSGDTVRVQQKIREAGKERLQAFEGAVIRTRRMGSVTASVTVRKISSGIGVEKTYLLHSPNVVSVQVLRRSKVRRNYLTYLRKRVGKATRLTDVAFNKEAVNVRAEAKQAEAKTDIEKKETKPEAPKAAAKPTEKPAKASEPKAKDKQPEKIVDKAQDKKAKAEAFRKAQATKQKK